MNYLVFPFGKYKGTKLDDLPSTYIVFALESFELPDELQERLTFIIHARFNVCDVIYKCKYSDDSHQNKNSDYIESIDNYYYSLIDYMEDNYKK
jgi:hypothetical protein